MNSLGFDVPGLKGKEREEAPVLLTKPYKDTGRTMVTVPPGRFTPAMNPPSTGSPVSSLVENHEEFGIAPMRAKNKASASLGPLTLASDLLKKGGKFTTNENSLGFTLFSFP